MSRASVLGDDRIEPLAERQSESFLDDVACDERGRVEDALGLSLREAPRLAGGLRTQLLQVGDGLLENVAELGALRLEEIGGKIVEEYKRKKTAEGLAAKTINNHLTILRRCLRSAVEWERLQSLPLIRPLKVPPPAVDFLNDDECNSLLSCKEEEPFAFRMVLTALRTGLRLSELCGLRWSDIDVERGILTVAHSIVRGVEGSPKSNRIRHIPMTKDLIGQLKPHQRAGGLVFPSLTGRALSDRQAAWMLRRVCQRTHVRRVGWHRLRHTFASQLVTRGVPIRQVQVLLGHSTVTMTERYAHLAPSSLSNAIQVLEQPTEAPTFLGNPWATSPRSRSANEVRPRTRDGVFIAKDSEKTTASAVVSRW